MAWIQVRGNNYTPRLPSLNTDTPHCRLTSQSAVRPLYDHVVQVHILTDDSNITVGWTSIPVNIAKILDTPCLWLPYI